ncbi:hypothetical protein [Vibrio hangzhouensis]|uniref:Uncharacterized protein n=1 Tax=Vibrio hangzhouensis TaxID=462991 RepID=A0A1H6BNL9_9VIBR|nr:hypothetical protein [Vibrio hangzhouensis]MBY6197801.1 hypothetical protein [Vibrio hangzhouensis]SEG62309.1 hypothetical protein SAMN04488244_12416 [Vibrio hangzhouensis]
MGKFTDKDIEYYGETDGVHKWETSNGYPYYWHPDWLHVAEDEMGLHPKQPLEVGNSEEATKEHAAGAIVKHMNEWMKSKLDKHPEIEDEAVESEHKLKGHDD